MLSVQVGVAEELCIWYCLSMVVGEWVWLLGIVA